GPDRRRAEPQPDKPAVFLLPGILGSHLKVNGERVWLSWRLVNGLSRLRYEQAQPDGVTPDAPIGMIYDDLVNFLRTTHEVIEFPYDWRKPIEEEARRLGEAVQQALTLRAKTAQPVRMIAHSMGGLLARAMQLECADVWDRMLAHPDARILMLGTPNGGSWAPMQVLTGDDTFGNALVTLGSPFRDHDARQMMAELPGFLQLQAGLSDSNAALALSDNWRKLADADAAALNQFNWWHTSDEQTAVFRWGVPTQPVLDSAIGWYRRLDAQRQKMPGIFRDKAVMVVGKAKLTPCGYESGERGLTYLHVEGDAGDGRVTLENAALPGVPIWQIAAVHGDLPKARDCFEGFLELLQSGSTKRLAEAAAGKRGAASIPIPANGELKRWRPSRERGAMVPPRGEDDLQRVEGSETPAADAHTVRPLSITVVNANLKFAHEPVMVGHYRGFTLTGTERVVDLLIGGTMNASLRIGRYPQTIETQLIFCNLIANLYDEQQLPRPQGVVVVGLGNEGELRTSHAMAAVRQGVIAWSQRLLELTRGGSEPFEFSSVLVGSGGIDVSAGASARFIAEGVWQANQRLALTGWPQVSRLRIYELYLDRASEAWRSLQLLSAAMPGRYDVEKSVQHGEGALRRPLDSSYRGADYDLISAVSQTSASGEHEISFTLDTRRARTEVRCVATQLRLLRELVSASSNDQCQDTRIRGTLFQLIVPLEIRPFLAGSTEMQIQLDKGTAGIPWELLDCAQADGVQQQDGRPWAIRSKLIRKLRTTDDRRFVSDATSDAQMLVIGEPDCDPTRYVRLPGARKEAEAVGKLLREHRGDENVRQLISDANGLNRPNARTIITTLLERDWRIVHIAGHGEAPDPKDASATRTEPDKLKDAAAARPDQDRLKGVVLSNDTFLGPREIKNMDRVPELVFVNCCHLAKQDTRQLLSDEKRADIDRPQFAANVAEALIEIGVRCVIAAGWAVDDDAAETFATTFYRALLAGERFGDAVGQARDASWRLDGNTWAAYQCYGDANWRLHCKDTRPSNRKMPPPDYYASVASSPGLTLALEALITKSRYDEVKSDTHLERLNYLETRFGDEWGSIGTIAEAFGMAWSEAGWDERAVGWYEKALQADDGSASLRAAEQHANLSAKCAWAALSSTPVNGSSAAPAQKVDVAAARERLYRALERINALIALNPTTERHNICASAYKRLAMIERFARQPKAEREALEIMLQQYRTSLDFARIANDSNSFYPALNCIAAELVMRPPGQVGSVDADLAKNVEIWLKKKNKDSPGFWSVYSVSELDIYRSLADGTIADEGPRLEMDLTRLHARVPSVRFWRIVWGQCEFVMTRFCDPTNEREYKAAYRLLDLLRGWSEELGRGS
ncbi:MAG TPA: CHAT domain-containing protein, partial [Paraburkholderia sp.]|nr:CHAT domain-containing protein [Paraburkholderia sp.]